ncbi:phage head-tail adapter protein [Listeria monocytogenes]|nr:phage head-tail adapter protein [Listeria monocytogenes]EAG4505951.1 phage head-tail adapter protein [Listeria monocytogenes]
MRSKRTAIVLGYTTRIEVENGVWEDNIVEKKAKAQQQSIFQSRKEKAYLDDKPLTARFEIRGMIAKDNLNYVLWRGDKYKVRGIYPSLDSHFSVIEIGELI